MKAKDVTCLECEIYKCRHPEVKKPWPKKCPRMNYADVIKKTIDTNKKDLHTQRVNNACDETMSRGRDPEESVYMWPRVRELIEYAKILRYKKIGIAGCIGLIDESKTLARILTNVGFHVCLVNCMAGAATRKQMLLKERKGTSSSVVCNPLFQADVLNNEKTDLNVMVGLCLGHDILFIKNSRADVTPLVVKDRLTGHNPCVALYISNTYYKNRLVK
jgi:uncharacterized metal-binding protein